MPDLVATTKLAEEEEHKDEEKKSSSDSDSAFSIVAWLFFFCFLFICAYHEENLPYDADSSFYSMTS